MVGSWVAVTAVGAVMGVAATAVVGLVAAGSAAADTEVAGTAVVERRGRYLPRRAGCVQMAYQARGTRLRICRQSIPELVG